MEIIKQLYDIARLFEEVPNLAITSKSFGRIAEVELSLTMALMADRLLV